MKRVNLEPVDCEVKMGDPAGDLKPNVTESCIFVDENGEEVGFYLKRITGRLKKFIDVANAEFRTDNVPKSLMERSDILETQRKLGISRKEAIALSVAQYSTIIGSIQPRPHMRRPYPSRSSVHQNPKAKTFIKAMLGAVKECELLIKELMPAQYEKQRSIIEEKVAPIWRFGELFTSSISNFNIGADYHRDAGNLKGCNNVIITKRKNCTGGHLSIPEYGATIMNCDGSLIFYPAWKSMHGVTDINPTQQDGYRNSLVFYPLSKLEKTGGGNG